MTVSLAAVFIPVLFMGGIVGRLLHEFAVVIWRRRAGLRASSRSRSRPCCAAASCEPPHAGGARPVLPRLRAGLRRHAARLRPRRCGGRCGIGGIDDGRAPRSRSSPDRLPVHRHPQGLPPHRGHRPDLRVHGGGRRTSPSKPWWRTSRRSRTSCGRNRPRRAVTCRSSGASGSNVAPQHGPHLHPPEAPRPAAPRRQVIEELRPQARRRPRHDASTPQISPHDPHRRPAHQEPLPVHAPGRRPPRSSTHCGAQARGPAARSSPGCRTSPATSRSRSPQVIVDIDRDKAVRPRRDGLDQIEAALGNAYGSRQVSTIYTPTTSTGSSWSWSPSSSGTRRPLPRLYVRSGDGPAGAARLAVATLDRRASARSR